MLLQELMIKLPKWVVLIGKKHIKRSYEEGYCQGVDDTQPTQQLADLTIKYIDLGLPCGKQIGFVQKKSCRNFKYDEVKHLNLITPDLAEELIHYTRFHLHYNLTGVTTISIYGPKGSDQLVFDYTGYPASQRGELYVWVQSDMDSKGQNKIIKTNLANNCWKNSLFNLFAGDRAIAIVTK